MISGYCVDYRLAIKLRSRSSERSGRKGEYISVLCVVARTQCFTVCADRILVALCSRILSACQKKKKRVCRVVRLSCIVSILHSTAQRSSVSATDGVLIQLIANKPSGYVI